MHRAALMYTFTSKTFQHQITVEVNFILCRACLKLVCV